MKARYSYPLLFLLPSAMLALLSGVVVVGAGAGALWIFVYGDDSWPEAARTGLMAAATAVSIVALITLLTSAYSFGKRQEAAGGLRRAHVLAAVSMSVVLPLLVLLHQWRVGNLGAGPVPASNSFEPTPSRGSA